MRQIGLLAAAGHYALDHNLERLAEDHRRARQLALACHDVIPSVVNPNEVETNIVGLDLSGTDCTASEFASLAKSDGVWISALGPKYVRLVTHLDLDDSGVEKAIKVLRALLKRIFVAK